MSVITLDQIGRAAATAIAGSSAIAAKIAEIYDAEKAWTVFYSATGSRGALKEDMPSFTFYPEHRTLSETTSSRSYGFVLELALEAKKNSESVDQWTTVTEAGNVTLTIHDGAKYIEALLLLALDAVRAISPNLTYDSRDITIEPELFYPVVIGGSALMITVPRVLGSEIQL